MAAKPGTPNSNASAIDIFIRVRPVPKPSPLLEVDNSEGKVSFTIPRDEAAGYVNNNREHYEFNFNGIIGPEAKQDEVGVSDRQNKRCPCMHACLFTASTS